MNKHKKVLYADDDLDDKAWVSEACRALACALDIHFVENGREAMEYLSVCSGESLPGLIVLDLNMPELDGRQTLKRIKDDPRYQEIPVLIVTTSTNALDKDICNRLGASLYLTKPDTHHEWQGIIREMESFLA